MQKIATLLSIIALTSFTFPKGYFTSSGIIRHDKDISQYLGLGQRPEFACVGRYSESIASQDYAVGVLIAPQWVLTAAHFVQDSSYWNFLNTFYKTKRIIKHPKLEAGAEEAQWDGWDMALVELEQAVPDILPAKRYYGTDELGQTITKIGYGYIGNGNTGMDNPRKQEKLGGQNVIDAIGGTFEDRTFSTDVLVCDFDSPDTPEFNHFGSPTPLELEIGGSKGDSGGGVFMQDEDELFLVGIVSGALNRQIKYGAVMALARVSTANEWIDGVIDGD